MLSESGMRRCDCRNPLAPRSPVTLRICSAKTGVYSTQCPSPSMTGCVRPLRISSGVWCALMWSLPAAEDAISRERMPPARPKSNGGGTRPSRRVISVDRHVVAGEVAAEPLGARWAPPHVEGGGDLLAPHAGRQAPGRRRDRTPVPEHRHATNRQAEPRDLD